MFFLLHRDYEDKMRSCMGEKFLSVGKNKLSFLVCLLQRKLLLPSSTSLFFFFFKEVVIYAPERAIKCLGCMLLLAK